MRRILSVLAVAVMLAAAADRAAANAAPPKPNTTLKTTAKGTSKPNVPPPPGLTGATAGFLAIPVCLAVVSGGVWLARRGRAS